MTRNHAGLFLCMKSNHLKGTTMSVYQKKESQFNLLHSYGRQQPEPVKLIETPKTPDEAAQMLLKKMKTIKVLKNDTEMMASIPAETLRLIGDCAQFNQFTKASTYRQYSRCDHQNLVCYVVTAKALGFAPKHIASHWLSSVGKGHGGASYPMPMVLNLRTVKNDGLSLPWPLLDNNFRIRESELTIVTGRNGSGKSQMVGQIMHHLMTQEQRVCIASMEMPPATTLHRMVQQMNGHSEINKQQVEQSFDWLTNKLWMVNVVGSVKADELLEVFEYAHRRYGINQFVIDSLMRCGIREDDYSGQNKFVQKLCDFKLKTKAHVWLVSHPRKGESENQAPTKLDVRGASAITDNADNVLSLWRNPNKRESLNGMEPTNNNEPDATITIGKQRNGDGWEGKCFLWFNPVSKRFTDEPLPVDCLSIGHNKGRGPFKARASSA